MSFSFRIFRVALLFICQGSSFSFLLSFSSLFILPQPLSLVNYFFYLFSLSAGLCFCLSVACRNSEYTSTVLSSCQHFFYIFLFFRLSHISSNLICFLKAKKKNLTVAKILFIMTPLPYASFIFSINERRRRDLNPRAGHPTYTLSRGASSAS